MTIKRRLPPVWVMGLSNMSAGLYNGIAVYAVQQLLAERHVPQERIASISAVAIFPLFACALLGPILDIRISRRAWSLLLVGIESVLVTVALLNLDHLYILEACLAVASGASQLASSALGGWLATVTRKEDENELSAWYIIANSATMGATALLAGELMRHMSLGPAAIILGALVFLPAFIFLTIPCSPPDSKLAGESFLQFSREIAAMLRQRRVLIALVLFLSPCGTFASSTVLASLGDAFHASGRTVSVAGGVGAIVPGIFGSLMFPVLARWVKPLTLYFMNGIVGGLFTLSLVVLPHAPWTFTLAMIGEFMFASFSITTMIGIVFEIIGQNNPLAGTICTVLGSAGNVPLTYMMFVDNRGYSWRGLNGALIFDSMTALGCCMIFGLLFGRRNLKAAVTGALEAVPQEK